MHTPGPWKWHGEDYRAGWGWQMLVGPNGEGLIVGQDVNGEPSPHLRAFLPVDPALCIITGIDGQPHAECVHVFSEDNARLMVAAPDLLEALQSIENDDGHIPAEIWKLRNVAIAKATKGRVYEETEID